MQFSWDEGKNAINRCKHGVSFETATAVFSDPYVIFEQDREVGGEPRWQAVGKVGGKVLLLVAHAYEEGGYEENGGEETIRIISARLATQREQKAYRAQFREGGDG